MQINWRQDSWQRAWMFASRAHQGQTYGGALPGEQIAYINHLASVAMEVSWALQAEAGPGLDGDLALQCALLHDTLEDCGITYASVAAEFGLAVADGVQALSKNPALPKAQQLADSLQRILRQPREVAMVKLADRIANLYHPPFYWDDAKIISYQSEAGQILNALGAASPCLAARLQEKIAAYGRFVRGG
ncbi:HD domain-containing protein [Massilia sp. W12]|uniref:HD domain-containing protein n=1 Tax=Massilia sp. W12 TaxID=3126507 RepID=UPI0030CBFB34